MIHPLREVVIENLKHTKPALNNHKLRAAYMEIELHLIICLTSTCPPSQPAVYT